MSAGGMKGKIIGKKDGRNGSITKLTFPKPYLFFPIHSHTQFQSCFSSSAYFPVAINQIFNKF